ncbi:2-phosphosulfolactate phosphatase family protein [Clostridium paraputrificum]|uniref:2-phosphosulfolactate phosphatase family protein n=1 Tax=Clostridium TaxID=1485 RepID=UPI003D3584B0
MKIDVIISADYVRDDIIKDKVVVVIDILRATSVITTAMMNGCKEVLPLLTVEEAFEKKKEFPNDSCVLGGERRAVKIEGFDFSNSPLEYTRKIVENKTLIITTTNGTRTLTSCKSSEEVFIGCMLNASAVAKRLLDINKDVVIVNSGTNGQFSMDDYICTGFIIYKMLEGSSKLDLTDIAKTSVKIYEEYPGVIDYIKDARHYNVMMDLGLEKDIEYCIQKDITDIVPEYKNGYIKN